MTHEFSASPLQDNPPPVSRRWMIAIPIAIVMISVGTWWFLRDDEKPPTFLSDRTDKYWMTADPLPIDRAVLHIGLTHPRSGGHVEVITFNSVEARFQTNTADATATFSICVGPRNGGLGTATGDLARLCTEVRPIVDGTTMTVTDVPSPRPDYIVLTLTPTAPGTATVDQVAYDYARTEDNGGQEGRDVADGMTFTVQASR